jgi:hypothetical protein
MAHHVHSAVPLHPAFLCAMLPWEIFKMTYDNESVTAEFHIQANRSLIATADPTRIGTPSDQRESREPSLERATKSLIATRCE